MDESTTTTREGLGETEHGASNTNNTDESSNNGSLNDQEDDDKISKDCLASAVVVVTTKLLEEDVSNLQARVESQTDQSIIGTRTDATASEPSRFTFWEYGVAPLEAATAAAQSGRTEEEGTSLQESTSQMQGPGAATDVIETNRLQQSTGVPPRSSLQRGSHIQSWIIHPGAFPEGGPEDIIQSPSLDRSLQWATEDMTGGSTVIPVSDQQDEGLVEARAVEEGTDPVVAEARAVNLKPKEGHIIPYKSLGVGLLFLAALCTAVGLYVGIKNDDGASVPITNNTTPKPCCSPSLSPSSAPTGTLDLLLADLPEHTLKSLEQYNTPQWRARDWLSNHQNINNLPEWRKKQLFALATFFYAFGGENWFKPIQERWLDDSKDECFWFSTGFGYFSSHTGEYVEFSRGPTKPCNDLGQLTSLFLQDLRLGGVSALVPPEISLLSSLSFIDLGYNNLKGNLNQILPEELYKMVNLTVIMFANNQLTGQIPSELGQFNNMDTLELYGNAMTGSVPSELGLLTALTNLDMEWNEFSGALPSELSLMTALMFVLLGENSLSGSLPFWAITNLNYVLLGRNYFSGTIPTEIGFLESLSSLDLAHNRLSGTIPSEVGLLHSLDFVYLQNNSLMGTLPPELYSSVALRLDGNQFSGTVPKQLCSVLWCDCSTNSSLVSSCSDMTDFPVWPGRFPPSDIVDGSGNAVILNIQTDAFPEETEWVLYQKRSTNSDWEGLKGVFGGLGRTNLHSYLLSLVSSTAYKLMIFDSYGDGLGSNGWATLTGSNNTVLVSVTNEVFARIIVDVAVGEDGAITVASTIQG